MNLSVGRDVAAEPSVVWDLLVDTERWSQWGPSVAEVELTDVAEPIGVGTDAIDLDAQRIRAGSTGRVRTALGVWLPFAVTHFEPGRSWAWRVAGIPATTHCVVPHDRGCRVEFGIPALAAPYAVVCQAALRRIERLALDPKTPSTDHPTGGAEPERPTQR